MQFLSISVRDDSSVFDVRHNSILLNNLINQENTGVSSDMKAFAASTSTFGIRIVENEFAFDIIIYIIHLHSDNK